MTVSDLHRQIAGSMRLGFGPAIGDKRVCVYEAAQSHWLATWAQAGEFGLENAIARGADLGYGEEDPRSSSPSVQ